MLGRMRGEIVPCRFCGGVDGDGHLFGTVLFSPWLNSGRAKVLGPAFCFGMVGFLGCPVRLLILGLGVFRRLLDVDLTMP